MAIKDNTTIQYLPDWVKRVKAEKLELDDKRQRLADFLESPKFATLDDGMQMLLKEQSSVMRDYSNILARRIEMAQMA